MPSAADCLNNHLTSGFTPVEILAVSLLVALIVGAVFLASDFIRRARGTADRLNSRLTGGFTLIEILVVSLLIAIIAGTVFLSFDLTERAQVRDKADRLQHVLRNLGSEAVLTGRICGVNWQGSSLSAECRTTHGEVENMDKALGKFAWGNEMNLAVYGEDGEKMFPKDEEDEKFEFEDEENPNKFYDIQMWSTGLWEPAGSIVFKSASNKVAYLLVSWTASGRLSVDKVTDQIDYIEDYDPWTDQ